MNESIKISQTSCGVMSRNEKFLFENFKDVVDEIVELANDAIDYAQSYARQDKGRLTHGEKATHFYAYHILMPCSNALFTTLLTGNLPSCFRELRFMTEMMAKCFLADLHYPDMSFFGEKLNALHSSGSKKPPREIELIEEFAQKTNTDLVHLWRKLSDETHGRKFTERLVDNVVNQNNMPGYALMVPMPFTKEDEQDLNDLNSYVILFRKILNKTMPT